MPCSGGTPDYPTLIQYACDLFTNVRPVRPVAVTVPDEELGSSKGGKEAMSTILRGKPLLCLAFDDMVVSQLGISPLHRIYAELSCSLVMQSDEPLLIKKCGKSCPLTYQHALPYR
jgi:hypothetical protein